MATVAVTGRFDLTDAQWAVLELACRYQATVHIAAINEWL